MAKNTVKTVDPAKLLEAAKRATEEANRQKQEAIEAMENSVQDQRDTLESINEEIKDTESKIRALKDQRDKIKSEISPIEEQIQELKAFGQEVRRGGRKPSLVELPVWFANLPSKFGANELMEAAKNAGSEMSRTTAQNKLNAWIDAGYLTKPKHGTYAKVAS